MSGREIDKPYRSADALLSVSIDGDADSARKIHEVTLESGSVRGVTQDRNDSESDQDDVDDQGEDFDYLTCDVQYTIVENLLRFESFFFRNARATN